MTTKELNNFFEFIKTIKETLYKITALTNFRVKIKLKTHGNKYSDKQKRL